MNFKEYWETVKDIESPKELVFREAFFWVPRYHIPVWLTSLGGCSLPVVRVPGQIKNGFGCSVPVITLEKEAFAGNETVTDVILPPSLDRLPAGAFEGCVNLQNVVLPKAVTRIPENTFRGCSGLENVFYEGTM